MSVRPVWPFPVPVPPGVVVVTATAGAVPPVNDPVAVICGTLMPAKRPVNVTATATPGRAPPEAETSPGSMLGRATSASATFAALALWAIGAVVCPPHARVNVPPVGAPVIVTVWTSLVPE